jgi:CubicO group peptidase (beta-lactamase class C family)
MTGAFDKSRLNRLDEAMAGYAARGHVSSIATALSRRGETHVGTHGAARDTIFRIASMSKPVAAAAAMILVEECKLRLDEPVERLLPELADRRVLKSIDAELDDTEPAKRPILVRDLMSFTMGFGIPMLPFGTHPIQRATDALDLGQGPPHPQVPPAPDEWIKRFATLPLMHQPGEKWMYHTGIDVLGVLIARASGQKLEDFLRERLFDPLGMKDTGFFVPPEKIARFTACHGTDFVTSEEIVYDAADGDWSRMPAFPSAGGGLVSTVDDFLAFASMMLNGGRFGGTRILSRGSVTTMTTDRLTPAQKAAGALLPGYFDSHGWGFGVSVVTRRDDPTTTPDQYGWDGGLGSSWKADPAEEMTGIILTNRAWTSPNPPDVFRDFWTLAYAAIDD